MKDTGTLDLFKSMNQTGMLTAFENQDTNRDLVIDETENAELVLSKGKMPPPNSETKFVMLYLSTTQVDFIARRPRDATVA